MATTGTGGSQSGVHRLLGRVVEDLFRSRQAPPVESPALRARRAAAASPDVHPPAETGGARSDSSTRSGFAPATRIAVSAVVAAMVCRLVRVIRRIASSDCRIVGSHLPTARRCRDRQDAVRARRRPERPDRPRREQRTRRPPLRRVTADPEAPLVVQRAAEDARHAAGRRALRRRAHVDVAAGSAGRLVASPVSDVASCGSGLRPANAADRGRTRRRRPRRRDRRRTVHRVGRCSRARARQDCRPRRARRTDQPRLICRRRRPAAGRCRPRGRDRSRTRARRSLATVELVPPERVELRLGVGEPIDGRLFRDFGRVDVERSRPARDRRRL